MAVTLCLNMIVRNEERIIERCLESVVAHIGCWIICDTGSTDKTPELIETFFRKRGVIGELHHIPFVNFEHTRNEALEKARASPLDFDFLLLTDADMELRVHDPSFRAHLRGSSYSVVQQATISYWNVRLVRRDVEARYRGVTHEYLEVPAGQERLEGVRFIDHAEGSNRSEKLTRDIALLEDVLAQQPDHGRSLFYLAQSYRDAARWTDAATAYERRVSLGGWEEERWYARLQLARCKLKLQDDGGFLRHALRAWNERPHRAEPLYDLARYHRDRGLHAAATLFAAAGLRVAWPKDDALFIEDWVYRWALHQEYAISGYYQEAHRPRAGALCGMLALNRNVPADVRRQAKRNLRFYARRLQDIVPEFAAEQVNVQPDDSFRPTNPSLVRQGDRLWLVQRAVNYELTGDGTYVTADGGPVRTRNYLLELDPSFAVLSKAEILPPVDLPAAVYDRVLGFEDMRPFIWKGEIWATATLREQNPQGWCETVLSRIAHQPGDRARLEDWRILRPERPRQHEKNWMPAASGGDVRFIYSVAPTRILDMRGRLLSEKPSRLAAEHVRGGSQAVPFGKGWLAVCHEHVGDGRARHYLHRFVWLDRAGCLRRMSAPFIFVRPGVEFAAGLAWHPDGKHLIISFGVADSQSWIGRLPASSVPAML